MKSREQLQRENEMIQDMLKSGVEESLLKIPGVHHVSIGLKEVNGHITDTLCIRIYVQEKKGQGQLAEHEVLPAEINGIPTDVNIIPDFKASLDENIYRPLRGGIQVTNRIVVQDPESFGNEIAHGTLGCLATDNETGKTVLLSNWHVLMANNAKVGDRIYQPAPAKVPDISLSQLPYHPKDDVNAVGTIIKATINNKVDAAIAVIDYPRINGDAQHINEINGLCVNGRPEQNVILGQATAIAGQTVFKVGEVSGRTEGRIVDVNYPVTTFPIEGVPRTFTGQIAIQPISPDKHFSEKGDSGSVIIDAHNNIVGLLFASNGNAKPQITLANHIADVVEAMNISINFSNQSVSTSHSEAGTMETMP
ncbi:S1 family peptidase [Chitinophaga filiformis]|uniref:S1 family peptidase n=1 Tax=Chitinophaga filiformis TaxID=104663 RepID=UPI001F2DC3EC|nr:S1 family peptidase [Chitinophaga filiformis]MCF6406251.1 S1 family peptidase [Chitinophaga filiformis]